MANYKGKLPHDLLHSNVKWVNRNTTAYLYWYENGGWWAYGKLIGEAMIYAPKRVRGDEPEVCVAIGIDMAKDALSAL
jgi:hypothetical protein